MQELTLSLPPEQASDAACLKKAAALALQMAPDEIGSVQIIRRSIDARRGQPLFQLKVHVFFQGEQPLKEKSFDYKNVQGKPPVIIVGAGPAGLFAALKLLEKGLRPVILEQGKSVKERKYDIAKLSREQILTPYSNWCFGEGGAGTYSDGKLYTRSNKRGNIGDILQQLVLHGANPDILVDAHAHIGTDKLPGIIASIRQTITEHGGEYYFDTRVADFLVKNNTVCGAIDAKGTRYEGVAVILATGHSSRDIYELFHQRNWMLEAKPFAVGVRAEHPQALINEIQYRTSRYSTLLPSATYGLVAQVNSRGVFSFCMCPGGIIVPACTAANEIVVNGMSNSRRNSPFANAGIVVQVNLDDLKAYQSHGVLAGLRFQQELEQAMFVAAGNTIQAPAQRMIDFVTGKNTGILQKTSYTPGITSAPLHVLLPPFISRSLQEAFKEFDKKMHGYLSSEAMLLGVESRTSSPVRIPRNRETLEHVHLKKLYPCGEGAGYAGGITSSAIDGANCAEKIAAS